MKDAIMIKRKSQNGLDAKNVNTYCALQINKFENVRAVYGRVLHQVCHGSHASLWRLFCREKISSRLQCQI